MKKRILTAVAAALLLSLPALSMAQGGYAWWLTKTYKPVDRTIAGIPVEQIRPSWVAAQTFTRSSFTAREHADVYSAPDFKPLWEVRRDLNRDGKVDRALVGVARTRSGALERFLVIVTDNGAGGWKKIYSEWTPTDPSNYDRGFSYLIDRGKGGLMWNDCFECGGSLGNLKWNGKKFVIESVDEGYD